MRPKRSRVRRRSVKREAGHGVAVTGGVQVAAFGPADRGQETDAMPGQPGLLLPGRELHIRPGPPHRPRILVGQPIKLGAALPVTPGQLHRVGHAEAALLGRVDQEQATEGPERLPAQVGGGLLVHHRDPLTPAGQLVVATSPARPAPTTITSASIAISFPPRSGSDTGWFTVWASDP